MDWNSPMTLLFGVLAMLMVLVGLVFTGTMQISRGVTPLTMKTTTVSMNNPNAVIKVAATGGEEVKSTAAVLADKKEPHLLAISPETREVTKENLDEFENFLSESGPDTGIFMDIFGKCQSWMTMASPGASEFEVSDDIVNKYYEGLSSGGLATLNPTTISKVLRENTDTINDLCGEAGCPNSRTCATCWDLYEAYQEAESAGDFSAAMAIESQMIKINCARSCAELCRAVYPSVRKVIQGYQKPEVRKEFISSGIQLN